MWRLALLLITLASTPAFGETKSLERPPGIVKLMVDVPEGSFVKWESRSPLDLRYFEFLLKSNKSVFVFDAEPGKTYVIASDVVIWDQRDWDDTRWIIKTTGEDNSDEGDEDEGEDDGTKPPPIPDNIPNKYGIGPEVYSAARRVIRSRQELTAFIGVLKQFEYRLNRGELPGRDVINAVEARLAELKWTAVKSAFSQTVQAAAKQYGTGSRDVKNYIRETRLTLELLQ